MGSTLHGGWGNTGESPHEDSQGDPQPGDQAFPGMTSGRQAGFLTEEQAERWLLFLHTKKSDKGG